MTYSVAAFYKFAAVADPAELADGLRARALAEDVRGTILVAREGINGTISARSGALGRMIGTIQADPRFRDMDVKFSTAPEHPFGRLKVKVKPEIVTFGAPDEADPTRHVGTYVSPRDWNELMQRDDVVVIDTRNAYEVAIGTFPGACDPGTRSFSEFKNFAREAMDPARQPKVAMFCTGGIRCEKASAYMLSLGFPQVFHLEGGILRYLEEVPPEESLWQGECFVFDERVSVGHGVEIGNHGSCPDCGFPIAVGASRYCRYCRNCRP